MEHRLGLNLGQPESCSMARIMMLSALGEVVEEGFKLICSDPSSTSANQRLRYLS